MSKINLVEIAAELKAAGIPRKFEVYQSHLWVEIGQRLLLGQPVSIEAVQALAIELGANPEDAKAFLRLVSEQDEQENVRGIMGLSLNKHKHRFQVNGQKLTTWCAWDSLFIPIILNQTAKIESTCPETGEAVRLTVSPERVETLTPDNATVSIVTPSQEASCHHSIEAVWETFCCQVHFFCSSEAAAKWLSGRNIEAHILSVKEGYQLGRLAFAEILEHIKI